MEPWGKFAKPKVTTDRRPDGATVLTSAAPLGECDNRVGDILTRQAAANPGGLHLAQRAGDGTWHKMTYAETHGAARAIGQALLARGVSPERPAMIVAENGLEFALLGLGAALVGVPFAPVSAAYARPGQGFTKLGHVTDVIGPGLIFVDGWERYEAAKEVLDAAGAEIVVAGDLPGDAGVTPFRDLVGTEATDAVDEAAAAVTPDHILKILFTSGSTGLPKGVINTHRMICANQAMIAGEWPFLGDRPPVLLDWLPWSHTFGGNFVFYTAISHGGAYYIDGGKPAPGLIDATVENLREVTPTMLLNVPAGYQLLVERLEQEPEISGRLFANLDFMFYAAAAMPQALQQRIRALAEQAAGYEVPLVSAWGTTETAPLSTSMNFRTAHQGNIGVPVRGIEIKLAPVDEKLEIRVRGPNITPGYWRNPEATSAAFDEEGFYCSGDAVRFTDPGDPAAGLLFDGRIAENFKLATGTWVHVGELRLALISAAQPVVQDCVITGHDHEEIGAIVFPSIAGCRSLCPDLSGDAPLAEVIADHRVTAALAAGLKKLADQGGGSSMRVTRALIAAEPPTIDKGEITDKGYINQRAVLANRGDMVERLYAGADPEVVRLED